MYNGYMKFTLLSNVDWLKQEYVIAGKSGRDIAKALGCSPQTVISALRKHGLVVRTSSETKSTKRYRSKYLALNDPLWLEYQYIFLKKSILDIAKMIGVKTSNSVCQALRAHNIKVRTISEGLTLNREDDGLILNDISKQVIEGSLLGDGFLGIWNNKSKASEAYFAKRNKNKEHIEYVSRLLFNIPFKKRITQDISNYIYKGLKKKVCCYGIRTLSRKEITGFYTKWYPESNGYKKVIPLDLQLTKISLLHWFLDDGCSYLRKRGFNNQVVIIFSSESFSKEDQERMCDQMANKFGINAKVFKCKWGTGWRIRLPQAQTKKFFDLIGPCPVRCFDYKWKL